MLLSIIIISYNTKDLTLQTLDSVHQAVLHSQLLSHHTEVLIVDNNSSDDSVSAIQTFIHHHQAKVCHFTLIKNQENVGFAKANNQAINNAQGAYILLLNSDTVVQPQSLELMVQAFEDHPVDDTTSALASKRGRLDRLGILAATLLNPDGSPQAQGGSFPNLLTLSVQMLMLDDIPVIGQLLPSTQHTGRRAQSLTASGSKQNQLLQQDWVGGTAMMIRKAMIEEVGALDQNIFMYGEDVEFCMRAQDHQWDVAIHPQAKVTHFGSASSSSDHARIGEFRGLLYIWAKHKPLWQMPIAKLILRLGALIRVVLFGTILRNTVKARPYVTLLKDVLR